MIYTRKQYLEDYSIDGTAAHRRYFGQFVTTSTIARVVNAIGKGRLLASTDPHLNDIPLKEWDALAPMLPGSNRFPEAGDYYTLSNGVCLAKEAARHWLDAQKVTQ